MTIVVMMNHDQDHDQNHDYNGDAIRQLALQLASLGCLMVCIDRDGETNRATVNDIRVFADDLVISNLPFNG